MTPDEVINNLKKIGVEISRPTLSRYEKQELIPIPKRGGLGRGGGRWTDYPENTVEEAYAAWTMMHGVYGIETMNDSFFGGKPPKISPVTIKRIKFLNDFFQSGTIMNEEQKREAVIELTLRKLDIVREKPQASPKSERCIFPERLRIESRMSDSISAFLSLVWFYEVDQAREKLNAIR